MFASSQAMVDSWGSTGQCVRTTDHCRQHRQRPSDVAPWRCAKSQEHKCFTPP